MLSNTDLNISSIIYGACRVAGTVKHILDTCSKDEINICTFSGAGNMAQRPEWILCIVRTPIQSLTTT